MCDTENMTLTIALVLGSAALALWTYVRLVGRTPTHWIAIVAHLAGSFVVLAALAPALMRATLEQEAPASGIAAVLFVALPAISYLFLASLWLLAFAARALGGGVR
jgi:hypothetical protein